MYRNSYLQIDLDNIVSNAEYYLKRSNKNMIGVVKANGYGTVDYMEVSALKKAGISFFAVSSLDEALNLRNNHIDDKILILGYVNIEDLETVRENNFSIVTVSKEYVEKADLKGVNIHLKLNTGMNRIGINIEDASDVLQILLEKDANVEGIMSHFSSADTDAEHSKAQYKLFRDCVTSLNYDFKYIHMSATDAALIIDDDICNYQRIGLGLLGYSSHDAGLKPALQLFSEISMVKTIRPGDTVSYGRHYTSDGKGYILTVPIGYADGFYRANTGKKVYVENEYGTIVGSVCMDQMMILTDHYHEVGTAVELYGDHIDLVRRAEELHTIGYELITSISDRISRIYLQDHKIVKIISPRF